MYRVVMPALEMAQDTGTLLRWLKHEGEQVQRGEPLMEIETDKVTLEIESGGSGVLTQVSAGPGDEVPVGQVIALLLAEGEEAESVAPAARPAFPFAREPLAGALTRKPCCSDDGPLLREGARRCGGQSAGAAPGRRAWRGPERAARDVGAHLEGGRAGLVAA